MSDRNEKRSSARIILPFLLILAGILILKTQSHMISMSEDLVSLIGLSIYTIGSFTFVIILNHAKNPFVSKDILVNTSQALVVYGGLIVAMFRSEILGLRTSLISVGIILIIGSVIAVSLDFLDSR